MLANTTNKQALETRLEVSLEMDNFFFGRPHGHSMLRHDEVWGEMPQLKLGQQLYNKVTGNDKDQNIS